MNAKHPFVARHERRWPLAGLVLLSAASLFYAGEWLRPLVHGMQEFCVELPMVAAVVGQPPHPSVVFTGILLLLAGVTGACFGISRWGRTIRTMASLNLSSAELPDQVVRLTQQLGLRERVLIFEDSACAAFCYGFLQPKIAISTGLVQHLDEEELLAVLAHERHHVVRRDPLRLLMLHALAGSAWVFPIARFVRRRMEAQIEIAADQAAIAVSSPEALAGALLAVLKHQDRRSIGSAAGLSATEARVTYVVGQGMLPEIPMRATVTSTLLLAAILISGLMVTQAPSILRLVCDLCQAMS